ncbi:MAG: methyltransferase domain-containing protein [Bryobacteraceae bacterium]
MNPAEFATIARSEQNFWWYRGMRRILFRLLDDEARGREIARVLEAGCGTGHLALEIERRYGWSMIPLDLAWEGLRHGRRLGAARLVQGDIAALPFARESFDAVISMDVIVHFPRGQESEPVAEFARVLRPNGLLVLRVSALDMLRSRHSEFAHELQRFTRGRLRELAESQGFRVVRCTYLNSLLMPVALAKFRIWEPLTRQPPASGVVPVPGWLDAMLYAPLALEARWLGVGGGFPLGQSLALVAEKA